MIMAYQALEAIANADSLAVKTGSENHEMDFWLDRFERRQTDFKKKLNESLSDEAIAVQVAQGMIMAEEAERAKEEKRMHDMLARKLGGFADLLANNSNGSDTSLLNGALGQSVSQLTSMNAARHAADDQELQNLNESIADVQADAARQLGRRDGVLDSLWRDKRNAEGSLSTLDNLIRAVQKAA